MDILRSLSQTVLGAGQDVEDLFGKQVAAELKQVQDKNTRIGLRRTILLMIYDAQENEQRSTNSLLTSHHYNTTPQHNMSYNY